MTKPDFSTKRLSGRWRSMIESFLSGPTGERIQKAIAADSSDVYPPTPFLACELTPFENVRVVVIGQDPYHTPGKAEGLAFSVGDKEPLPPSLRNIFKALAVETGSAVRTKGSLRDWAQQGVLLLNTCFTVRRGEPLSHAKLGWETLSQAMVKALSDEKEGLVFLLWGAPAQKYRALIDEQKHCVIMSSHPSPLSATRGSEPFMTSKCFTRTNSWLQSKGLAPIRWLSEGMNVSKKEAEPRQRSLFETDSRQ